MKRKLRVGDYIKVFAKDRKYKDVDYTLRVVDVTDKAAYAKRILHDGSFDSGTYMFNKNYDTDNLIANIYGKDPFNSWDRFVAPTYEEVWKDCWRYCGYEVSTLGNVRNKKTKHLVKPYCTTSHKRPQVKLCTSLFREEIGVAQLVVRTFFNVNAERVMVSHRDENAANNALNNLGY